MKRDIKISWSWDSVSRGNIMGLGRSDTRKHTGVEIAQQVGFLWGWDSVARGIVLGLE